MKNNRVQRKKDRQGNAEFNGKVMKTITNRHTDTPSTNTCTSHTKQPIQKRYFP